MLPRSVSATSSLVMGFRLAPTVLQFRLPELLRTFSVPFPRNMSVQLAHVCLQALFFLAVTSASAVAGETDEVGQCAPDIALADSLEQRHAPPLEPLSSLGAVGLDGRGGDDDGAEGALTGADVPLAQMERMVRERKSELAVSIERLRNAENELRQIHGVPDDTSYVWVSTVVRHRRDLFELANGAVVKKESYGYVGYVGFREDCLLYGYGSSWTLSIDRESFACEIVKRPSEAPNQVTDAWLLDVKASGRVLEFADGTLWEVNEIDTIRTSLWIGSSKILVFPDGRAANVNTGDIVRIWPL